MVGWFAEIHPLSASLMTPSRIIRANHASKRWGGPAVVLHQHVGDLWAGEHRQRRRGFLRVQSHAFETRKNDGPAAHLATSCGPDGFPRGCQFRIGCRCLLQRPLHPHLGSAPLLQRTPSALMWPLLLCILHLGGNREGHAIDSRRIPQLRSALGRPPRRRGPNGPDNSCHGRPEDAF